MTNEETKNFIHKGVVIINKVHSVMIALVLLIGIVAAVVLWKSTVEAGIISTQERVEKLEKENEKVKDDNLKLNKKVDEVIFNLKNFMENKGVKYQSLDK